MFLIWVGVLVIVCAYGLGVQIWDGEHDDE